jgi:hypothetical protein
MDIEDKSVIASEARQSDEVVARSVATWQSQPFHRGLLRPYAARNDNSFYEIASLRSQ